MCGYGVGCIYLVDGDYGMFDCNSFALVFRERKSWARSSWMDGTGSREYVLSFLILEKRSRSKIRSFEKWSAGWSHLVTVTVHHSAGSLVGWTRGGKTAAEKINPSAWLGLVALGFVNELVHVCIRVSSLLMAAECRKLRM